MTRLRLAIALLLLAVAGPLLAYTVVLKDGSKIIAREEYRVQGNQVIITLPNGTRTSLPLSEVDVAATRQANVGGHIGDAVVLGQPDAAELPTPPSESPSETSLSDVASQRRLAPRRPEPPPPAAPTPSAAELPRTPAGNVDLLRVERQPVDDIDLGNRLSRLLRARGLEGVAIYKGTRPERLFLEFASNSEAAVFEALRASAEALVQLVDQGSAELEALELFMATDRRVRAGQFLLTPAMARELVERRIDLPGFFVKYVQF